MHQRYIDAIGQVNAAGAVVVVAAGNSSGHARGRARQLPGRDRRDRAAPRRRRRSASPISGPRSAISAPGGNCVNTGAGDAVPLSDPDDDRTRERRRRSPTPRGGSIYTDSFNASLGTSFSAPLVAGTVALMLSVQPSLTPAQVRALLQATARPFPTTGGGTDGTPVPQCAPPQPQGIDQVDQLECYCTTSTCGAGMLDAGAAVRAVQTASINYIRTVLGRSGQFRTGLGHQLRALGRPDFRDLVHL